MPRSFYGQKNFPNEDGVCRGLSSFRFQFVEVVAKNHPEVLRDLYDFTYEAYNRALPVLKHERFGPSALQWEEVISQQDVAAVAHLIKCIDSWALSFALTADWIFDCALATLDQWHDSVANGEDLPWRWGQPPWPPEGDIPATPEFTLRCASWNIAFEGWQEFEKRLHHEYCRRKEEYRQALESESNVLPRLETRRFTEHAKWLAMRLIKSKKYSEIAEPEIDPSTVGQAVKTLAARIGLSLRSRRTQNRD